MAPDVFIDLSVILERLKIGKTCFYAMVKRGEFPEPTKFGRFSRWSEHQYDAWASERTKQAA